MIENNKYIVQSKELTGFRFIVVVYLIICKTEEENKEGKRKVYYSAQHLSYWLYACNPERRNTFP